MCFKNCFVNVAYIQVNLGSIFSCKLYEMVFFFSKFNKRLLSLNHLSEYLNTVVMSLIKSVGLDLVIIILVSYTNRIGLHLHVFVIKSGKSFI
jgi:hypothetical protein